MGGPSLGVNAVNVPAELAQVGRIRQDLRHPLSPDGFGSQSTRDDSTTGDHGQGHLIALPGLHHGGDVNEQFVGLRHEPILFTGPSDQLRQCGHRLNAECRRAAAKTDESSG